MNGDRPYTRVSPGALNDPNDASDQHEGDDLGWYPQADSQFWNGSEHTRTPSTNGYANLALEEEVAQYERASLDSGESGSTVVEVGLQQFYRGGKKLPGDLAHEDPFGDGSSTPVDQRQPPRFGAYTPFIPPTTGQQYQRPDGSPTRARLPQPPLSAQNTASQSLYYATPHSTGDYLQFGDTASASTTSVSRSFYPRERPRLSSAPGLPPVADEEEEEEDDDDDDRDRGYDSPDEDDWYISESGKVINRSSTLSPDNSLLYDIENRPSPRKSPMRKDATRHYPVPAPLSSSQNTGTTGTSGTKPKWVPTFSQLRQPSVSSRHTDKSARNSMQSQEPPASPLTTRHFGPAPAGRAHRRHKQLKRVQLTKGNLIVDLDVPPQMVLPYKREPEMLKTRYTAVRGDPDDFERNNFFLRQNMMQRTTELFIVVTMYNEDEVLFCRTLHGVMQNISHLCTRKNSRTWGPDSWKKVVVCIVADGRKKITPAVLDCLTLLGVYQPGDHMKRAVNNHEVTAHVFEYTTSFGLDPNIQYVYPDKGIVPTQILFCLKEKNQKKINSHRWAFRAFGPLLQPNVCVLLDVGTMPGPKSIYHLWKTFDLNSNVGGACGEIAVYKGPKWKFMLNPLVASQDFEYKMSNILDKTTESMFGYISVLPGAFSAYRYIALQNDERGIGPLASYFKGEVLHGRDTDIFTSNMYLAEDRILCFELIAKAGSAWVLKYVNRAIAHTDVPDTLSEFITQRRRWLNGSFFAATYAIAHAGQIFRSGHSIGRKIALGVQVIYNCINLTFSWFAIGNFYLFFVILTSSLEAPYFGLTGIQFWNFAAQYLFASLVITCFILSMGNTPSAARWKYKIVSILLALMMIYLITGAIFCLVRGAGVGGAPFQVMVFGTIITYGVYFASSLLALDPWHLLISFVPYVLLSPTYFNILNVYAFANLDDISWGTKGDTAVAEDLGAVTQNLHAQVDVEVFAAADDVNAIYADALETLRAKKFDTKPKEVERVRSTAEKESAAKDYYANVRTNVLLFWVISNGLLLVFILGGGVQSNIFEQQANMSRTKAYLTFILAFVALTNIIRFIGSTLYLGIRLFTG